MNKVQQWIEQEFATTEAALKRKRAEIEAKNKRSEELNEARRVADEIQRERAKKLIADAEKMQTDLIVKSVTIGFVTFIIILIIFLIKSL